MNEDKPKSEQQILKERTLAKAIEVVGLALEKNIDEIWTTKNRVVKAQKESMNISVALVLEKMKDNQLHVSCTPSWSEKHNGKSAGGDVSTTEELGLDD